METTCIKTEIGVIKVVGDENGLSSVSIGDEFGLTKHAIPDVLQEAIDQLEEYFIGSRTHFDLKLNPNGTDFQKSVWNYLSKVPFGKTKSYLEQAKEFGNPKAIRAIASANAKNPLWIVVPCHRIIGTDGSLTGYAGGLWRKKWLLEHENPSIQLNLF